MRYISLLMDEILLMWSILSPMSAGDANQITSVQLHMFSCCVLFYTNCACAILISIRVLLVTWCALINNKFKQFNCCVLRTSAGISQLLGG